MAESRPSRLRRLADALGRLSLPALALIGVVVAAGVGAGGYYAYSAYDYVEHDNDFCLSCHLMQEPFELFAQSAHQDLGCKACHQPTLAGRSAMALTQFLENPDELSVHAEVPNEVCAACHIQGDPDRWRSIANSAGHRVHFESDDPVLEGLQCVECHSTSLHEFAPIDRTCAQSGCHEDSVIRLGGMSQLTIHCSTCHGFVEEVAPMAQPVTTGGAAAMRPDFDECFSCHVMRTLVELPNPDPHEAACGSCHNPHTQDEPSDAVASCATAGCHQDVGTLTPYHRGLETEVVTNCLYCHEAHDFALTGDNCALCHAGTDPLLDPPGALLDFAHADHQGVQCTSCHVSTEAHAAVSLAGVQDCRSCHHTSPVSQSCSDCHTAADTPTETFTMSRAVSFSVGPGDAVREQRFPHPEHLSIDCASCHTEGLARAVPPNLDCTSCHQEHHTPETDCASCHRVAPEGAHPPAEAHVTCSGAACHQSVPFQSVPRTRAFCLGCHQDMVDHEPGGVCVTCHALPAPRPGGGLQ